MVGSRCTEVVFVMQSLADSALPEIPDSQLSFWTCDICSLIVRSLLSFTTHAFGPPPCLLSTTPSANPAYPDSFASGVARVDLTQGRGLQLHTRSIFRRKSESARYRGVDDDPV